MQKQIAGVLCVVALLGASGCSAVKATSKATMTVASLPFKGTYYAAKGVGHGTYQTGKFAAKSLYYTGKGAYHLGRVPVDFTRGALDTTADVLQITASVTTTAGQVAQVTSMVSRAQLEQELAVLRATKDVSHILVDAAF